MKSASLIFLWGMLTLAIFAQPTAPVPTHPSPLPNAVGVGIDDQISWVKVSGADSYGISLCPGTVLAPPYIVSQNIGDVDHYLFTHLANDADYCYQVASFNNTTGWGPTSPLYHFRTVPAEVPILLTPILGERGVSIDPVLAWTCLTVTTGFDFKLQIADDINFTVNLQQSGWVPDLNITLPVAGIPELHQGAQYFWRIVSRNHTTGAVCSYSTPSYFTTTGLATAPVITSPANTLVEYTNKIPTNDVTISWYVPTGSAGLSFYYHYRVKNAASWLPSLAGTSTTDLFTVLNLAPDNDYEFELQSYNGSAHSAWSRTTFHTNGAGTNVVPIPTWPVGAGTYTPFIWSETLDVTLAWTLPASSGEGLYYDVELSTNGGANWFTPVGSPVHDALSLLVGNLLPGGNYVWHVRSNNGATQSAWSTVVGSFTMNGSAASIKPKLIAPANHSEIYTNKPMLSWIPGAQGAVSFRLRFGTDINNPAIDTTVGKDVLYYAIWQPLANGTTYYWSVSANNGVDLPTVSAVWDLSTVGLTGSLTPVLLAPVNEQIVMDNTPLLSWVVNGLSVSPLGYVVEVATENTFAPSNRVFQVTLPAGSDMNVKVGPLGIYPGLVSGAQYYWRVCSTNPNASMWSATGVFKTDAGNHPVVVVPGELNNGMIVKSLSPTLSWYPPVLSTSVLTYDLEYATNADFTSAVKKSDLSIPAFTAENLVSGTTYYWRVQSKIPSGEKSGYSPIASFIPMSATAVTPAGVLPASYKLAQNYPNPFNPETVIKYSVKVDGKVVLKVYNMLGSEVATLVNEFENAGDHQVRFSASGLHLSSGIYLYRITSGSFSEVKKMMLLK